jgi:purine-binding chemotaxis protein CheW
LATCRAKRFSDSFVNPHQQTQKGSAVESSNLKKRMERVNQLMPSNFQSASELTGRLQGAALREAAQNALTRLQDAQSGAAQLQPPALSAPVQGELYLIFTLLEREFALDAERIQGVERLVDVTPVPNVAAWVTGVINLRGSIASVIDLRTFLDLERLPYNPRTRLLTVQYHDMVICLVVDSVSEMLPIPESAIVETQSTGPNTRQVAIPQWIAPYASGSARVGKRSIVLLDAARLLFSDKMQHYEI